MKLIAHRLKWGAMRRIFAILAVSLVLLASMFALAGCQPSKAAYEKTMVEVLAKTAAEMRQPEKDGKAGDLKRQSQRWIVVLKKARDKIKAITPPDDVFAAHSDIIEFLDLFIASRQAQSATLTGARQASTGSPASRDEFEKYQGAMTAVSRARSALPFLDYELKRAFEPIIMPGFGGNRLVPPEADRGELEP